MLSSKKCYFIALQIFQEIENTIFFQFVRIKKHSIKETLEKITIIYMNVIR